MPGRLLRRVWDTFGHPPVIGVMVLLTLISTEWGVVHAFTVVAGSLALAAVFLAPGVPLAVKLAAPVVLVALWIDPLLFRIRGERRLRPVIWSFASEATMVRRSGEAKLSLRRFSTRWALSLALVAVEFAPIVGSLVWLLLRPAGLVGVAGLLWGAALLAGVVIYMGVVRYLILAANRWVAPYPH